MQRRRAIERGKAPAVTPAVPEEVRGVLEACPEAVRERLLELRELIFVTAAALPEVGPLTETLKWGEPAYLTEASRSGSTIRIGWKAVYPDRCAMYLNCQTTLVDTYRNLFPELDYEGNRAVWFDVCDDLPRECVERCIELALTYHLRKRHLRKKHLWKKAARR